MKVYVVTEGNYSRYHIVFVTIDKARADAFVKRYNKIDYDDYRVEEYDTEMDANYIRCGNVIIVP